MSDTPRTDAAVIRDKMILTEVGLLDIVDAGTSRTLERELVAAKAEIERLREALRSLHDAVAEMRVPQNTAEAGLQIMITIGPALEFARRALGADK